MARILRPVISVTLISLTVLGLINVNEDPQRVEELAASALCSDCEATLRGGSTNPFQMKFNYRLDTQENAAVVCRKALIFLGPYHCAREKQ